MKNKVKAAILTAFIVTSYISFTLVYVNYGFNKNFVLIWLRSWLTAFIIAIPSLLFIAPIIKKLLRK
jgi:hypothetical protein